MSGPPSPPLDRRIWLRSEWAALTEAQRVAVLARGPITLLPRQELAQ